MNEVFLIFYLYIIFNIFLIIIDQNYLGDRNFNKKKK